MQVCFIKTSHQEYTLECTRDDRSVTQVTLEAKSYLKHDIVHFCYEREAGLRHSFYGVVNDGRKLESLTPKAMKGAEKKMGGEIDITEIIVGSLQGALATGVLPLDFVPRMHEYVKLQGHTPPEYLTPPFAEQVFREIGPLLRRYDALKTGERLCLTFP